METKVSYAVFHMMVIRTLCKRAGMVKRRSTLFGWRIILLTFPSERKIYVMPYRLKLTVKLAVKCDPHFNIIEICLTVIIILFINKNLKKCNLKACMNVRT